MPTRLRSQLDHSLGDREAICQFFYFKQPVAWTSLLTVMPGWVAWKLVFDGINARQCRWVPI